MGLKDNEKKALVRLQLIDKDTNQVKKELGFGVLVGIPNEKGMVNQEEVHLLTSSSVFQDDVDQHLDQIVVDQKKPGFLSKLKGRPRRDPVKLKEIVDDKRNVKYRKVLFEGGDKENYLKVLRLSEKCKKEFGLKTLSAYMFKNEKIIEFKFENQDGTYKLKNVVKGFDVKRAKGAPVITTITINDTDGRQVNYGNHVVGVLSIDEHGVPYPDLFTVDLVGEAPTSSGDVTGAGPSQDNSQQSGKAPTSSGDVTGAGPSQGNSQQPGEASTSSDDVTGAGSNQDNSQQSGEGAERNHFIKLARLLECEGTKVMRELFDFTIHPAGLATRLSSVPVQTRLVEMKCKKLLTTEEWQKLYESGTDAQSTSFDISLLFKLLRENVISGLSPPSTGWDKLPNIGDLSLSADMARIHFYQNAISCADEKTKLKEEEFNDYWNETKNALLRIVGHYATVGSTTVRDWKTAIDNILTGPPSQNVEKLTKLYLPQKRESQFVVLVRIVVWLAKSTWLGGTAHILKLLKDHPELLYLCLWPIIKYMFSFSSIKLTLQAETVDALDKLWKSYETGQLKKDFEKILLTEELKTLANGKPIELSVEINEEEFMKTRECLRKSEARKAAETKPLTLKKIKQVVYEIRGWMQHQNTGSLKDREEKAIVKLQLIDKDTNQVKKELGCGVKVYIPKRKEVHLLTSSSVFQDDLDQHLDEIVVHQKKPGFFGKFKRRRDPMKLKEIVDDKRNVNFRKVVFEGGDQKNCLNYGVLSEEMKKGLKELSACVIEGEKILVLQFENQDGTYKWKNVVKGFDVKRAKGAPVIVHITYMQVDYGKQVVGVLSIDEHGIPHPDLFTEDILDERPAPTTSNDNVEEAGPSQGNNKPENDIQTKVPRSTSNNDMEHAQESKKLKEAIKYYTEYQPKFMTASDITDAKTDDIYTNLTIYQDKTQVKIERQNDPSRSEHLKKYINRAGHKVDKCKYIFLDRQGRNPKRLLLLGKPGIGKSLLCQKLIRDLANEILFENEDSIDIQFPYLLLFRQLSLLGDKEMNLRELLNCSPILDEHSNTDESLFEYLIANPSKVLIILDGYDEYSEHHRREIGGDFEKKYPNNPKKKMPIPALCSKLIKGKLLRNSVVLVSSKPGGAADLGKIHFDRHVEISGFSPEQVTKYVEKYFSEPKKEQIKNTVLEHITQNENLVSFCHIPLLSFLLCLCLEWRISQNTENRKDLPAKITDLYCEVVEMLVQKLHANLKYPEELTEMERDTLERETRETLGKLAGNLLVENKFIFDEEHMKTLNLNQKEIENLKVSGILHCIPGIRISVFETKTEYSFTHLTLQEYLAASFFVKNKEIPKKEKTSGQTFVFMAGLLSREKDEELMRKLTEEIKVEDVYDDVNKLLMLECLYEYGDDELSKRTIDNLQSKYCIFDGWVSFHSLTDMDVVRVSYLLNIIGLLSQVQHPLSSPVHLLDIRGSSLTSRGVDVVCDSLVRNSYITSLHLSDCGLDDKGIFKITYLLLYNNVIELSLYDNNITDEGAKIICRVFIDEKCCVKRLILLNNMITEECKESLQELVKQYKPGVELII